MGPELKANLTGRLLASFEELSSQTFPQIAKIVLDHKFGIQLELRGQTIAGEPVGHILDANTDNFKEVAEFSTNKTYFSEKGSKKIINDYKHCLDLAPNCEKIFLISPCICNPKRYSTLARLAKWVGRRIVKEIYIYDGKWLAAYIMDQLLIKQDSMALGRLESYLPFFTQLRNEFAFANSLPELVRANLPRDNEVKKVVNQLNQNPNVQINGLSGLGKTYLAVQVVHELIRKDPNQMIVWIPGALLHKAEELRSLKIERYSVPQNITGLMQRFKCIVVIDSLEKNVDAVVQLIKNEVTADYRLIITSQSAADLIGDYAMPPANEQLSRQILDAGLAKPCQAPVYNQIMSTVGGHPFLLNQINILVKKGQLSWTKLIRQIDDLPASEFDNQSFYDRLFEHHLQSAGNELSVLKWTGSRELDETMLFELIGKTGIRKLQARHFFNTYRNGAYVLHDIVLSSLRTATFTVNESQHEARLAERLKKLYKGFDSAYYRIVHAHKHLVRRLLEKNRQPDIFCYSYILSVTLSDYDERLIPIFSQDMLSIAFRNFNGEDYFLVMSWIEQTEKEYRRIKGMEQYDDIEPFLRPKIELIERLLLAPNRLSAGDRRDVRNHLGKFLRDINDRQGATRVFEDLLKQKPDFWAAKFHLSKLYRKDNKELAQQYLSEIINAVGVAPDISSTIALAAFKECRSHPDMNQLLLKFIDVFKGLLEQVMVSRFDQPYEVLGALSSKIQFNLPEKMIELCGTLPIPAEDAIENKTLFDVGMIYLNTGKAFQQLGDEEKATEYFRQAMAYYEKLDEPDKFQQRGIAEAFLLLNDPAAAMARLVIVPVSEREIWWKYTSSKALRMSGSFNDALTTIEEVIQINKNKTHWCTFYRERGLIKQKLGMTDFKDDYDFAIENCDDPKFITIMEKDLLDFSTQV